MLPSPEEMVRADRQQSTATTFRSMTAKGMKGSRRERLLYPGSAPAFLLSGALLVTFTLLLSVTCCGVGVRDKPVAPCKL